MLGEEHFKPPGDKSKDFGGNKLLRLWSGAQCGFGYGRICFELGDWACFLRS
jgi:hypothetical protein